MRRIEGALGLYFLLLDHALENGWQNLPQEARRAPRFCYSISRRAARERRAFAFGALAANAGGGLVSFCSFSDDPGGGLIQISLLCFVLTWRSN